MNINQLWMEFSARYSLCCWADWLAVHLAADGPFARKYMFPTVYEASYLTLVRAHRKMFQGQQGRLGRGSNPRLEERLLVDPCTHEILLLCENSCRTPFPADHYC